MVENKVTINVNGKPFSFPGKATYGEVVRALREQLPDDVFLVQAGKSLRELHHKITDGMELRFITMADAAGRAAYLRSLRLLMHRAIWEVSGDDSRYDVRVLFSVSDGLFCKMKDPSLLTDELLEEIRFCMLRLVDEKCPIKKKSVSTQEARKIFHDRRMYDKEQLFKYRISSTTNIYELDGYEDYFYGYMLSNTAFLKYFDLFRFGGGFILRAPVFDKNGKEKEFNPDRKLFQVQKESFEWGEKIGLKDVGDLNDAVVSGDMSNLILTQEAYHEMQIANIAAQIAADPGKQIILIAGPSSSGKTTFSHRLSTQLSVHGLRPYPIPVDDYFVDREKTPLDENGNYNFEALEAIDVKQFNQDMLQLLDGKEVSLPTFNFRTGRREYKGRKLQLKQGDVLVIEGIHGLNDGLTYALPQDKIFRIYISALTQISVDEHNRIPTTDGRLIRRIVRDARTRGTTAAGTIAMWPSVRRGEEEHIFPHQGKADVMFNSALIYELAVLKIYAEPLLHGIDPGCDEYLEAKRLLKFLSYFVPIAPERIPMNSLLREFIGGSCFDV